MLPTRRETLGNGRMLRSCRMGSGPPLVLLHGYPETLQVWSEVAPRLAERHAVVALDWPGMGESEAWPGGATPHAQADRLAALLDEWGIPSAHVAGLDMGGQPALVFAARHATRCRSVTVMSSLVMGDERTSWEIRVLRRFGWNRLILRHLPGVVFRRAERTFLPRDFELPAELREDFWRCFRRAETRTFIVRLCAGYQGTLALLPELYVGIACPTLILWGELDAHFPPIHARRLHELVPRSRLVVVPGGHHWLPIHRPDAVSEAMESFLRDAEVTLL
jgi:pimeloyl-ACP methyl ester carboxylesterase